MLVMMCYLDKFVFLMEKFARINNYKIIQIKDISLFILTEVV